MSKDLRLKLTQKLRADSLVPGVEKELKELINQSAVPIIELTRMVDGVLYELNNDTVLQQGDSYFIGFKSIEATVGLVLLKTELQLPYITQKDVGEYIGIIAQGDYPVKYLLSGALAIYISRICGTKIFDDSCFWSKHHENDAESFVNSIKYDLHSPKVLPGVTDDTSLLKNIQIISEEFYNLLISRQ